MDDQSTAIDAAVNNYLKLLDPVGLPLDFYIILIIGGLLGGIVSYIVEVTYDIDGKPITQVGREFKFKTLSVRLAQSYTLVFACAYIFHGFGFNLAINAGLCIIAAAFNQAIFLVLRMKIPGIVSSFIEKYSSR